MFSFLAPTLSSLQSELLVHSAKTSVVVKTTGEGFFASVLDINEESSWLRWQKCLGQTSHGDFYFSSKKITRLSVCIYLQRWVQFGFLCLVSYIFFIGKSYPRVM